VPINHVLRFLSRYSYFNGISKHATNANHLDLYYNIIIIIISVVAPTPFYCLVISPYKIIIVFTIITIITIIIIIIVIERVILLRAAQCTFSGGVLITTAIMK